MTPCWFGLHNWSRWGDCFSDGTGKVMQARYCLRCRCAGTRTVVEKPRNAGATARDGEPKAGQTL